ncbi:MAG TPA: hypothetical protein ENN51_00820, partial [candidate division WOR-3 bacterium]|nr:hypothetical protein [candidate division WOR-3 bacterium]
GFEAADVVQALWMLLAQLDGGPRVEVQYRRSVRPEGNPAAKRVMGECSSRAMRTGGKSGACPVPVWRCGPRSGSLTPGGGSRCGRAGRVGPPAVAAR